MKVFMFWVFFSYWQRLPTFHKKSADEGKTRAASLSFMENNQDDVKPSVKHSCSAGFSQTDTSLDPQRQKCFSDRVLNEMTCFWSSALTNRLINFVIPILHALQDRQHQGFLVISACLHFKLCY